eukprot:6075905-Amphidinium_carterae.1
MGRSFAGCSSQASALAIVFDYYREDQRATFLHTWEDLQDLKCKSDAELPLFWSTWQYLLLSAADQVPEHLLLELLWSKVKDLRTLSDEWTRSPVRAPPYSIWPGASSGRSGWTRCIASEQRCSPHSEQKGSSTDPSPEALELAALPDREVASEMHDPEDEVFAVPGFTGKPKPKSRVGKDRPKSP